MNFNEHVKWGFILNSVTSLKCPKRWGKGGIKKKQMS
jgi:hypothetical protein